MDRNLAKIFNLPNQLTSLRLLLSVVLFWLMTEEHYLSSLTLFIIAAGTDWLDGYYARKYGQITTLGRILDPFADKVIVCGTFILLAAAPIMLVVPAGLRPWMVVVIVGRELLVTALRSFIEDRGSDFSANLSGKLKMVFQCLAAGACLFYLHYPPISPGTLPAIPQWAMPGGLEGLVQHTAHHHLKGELPGAPAWVWWVMVLSVWSAVVLTVYSGVVYVFVAVRLLRQDRKESRGR